MKTGKQIIIMMIIIFTGFQVLFAQSLGDVDNNGSIDIVDALLVAQYYVGLDPSNFNAWVADVDGSGGIDIVDALLIAQFYAGLITQFPAGNPTPTPGTVNPNIPWDWASTIGTGQSLTVGDHGTPVNLTTQPFSNLKLSTGSLAWPVDPNNSQLAMVPLIEPVGRLAPNYPSSWPENIAGETCHSAMGNQITSMVRSEFGRDYIVEFE